MNLHLFSPTDRDGSRLHRVAAHARARALGEVVPGTGTEWKFLDHDSPTINYSLVVIFFREEIKRYTNGPFNPLLIAG